MISCGCPAAPSLPEIPNFKCAETFGQINKVAFQRLFKDDGTKNTINYAPNTSQPAAGDIRVLATWTPLLAADDSTKIVISPYFGAPTAEAGAARTFGGGNETVGGVEEIIGREPTPFTASFRKVPQNVIKALKALQCESWTDNLGVYLFDNNGAIGAIQEGADSVRPIPIRSLFIGDKTLGGLEAPDANAIQWTFLPNWSDDLLVINPNFNPLDLQNA